MPAALVVVVSVRTRDGGTVARQRLCWAVMPTAAELVGEIARRSGQARQCGLSLHLDGASPAAMAVLDLAGLSGELAG